MATDESQGREVTLTVLSIIIILVLVGYIYWKLKSRNILSSLGGGMKKDKGPPIVSREPRAKSLNYNQVQSSSYKPVEVGHRTEKNRVFHTSKGLRIYTVNTDEIPLPLKRK